MSAGNDVQHVANVIFLFIDQLQISSGGSAGVVVIYSNITKRYLSMDKKGRLVGQVRLHFLVRVCVA